METLQPIVGHTITRLMRTQSRSAGVILEEFGEAYWIELVAELEEGRAIQIDEYDWSVFEGRLDQCIRAQLVQSDYSLSDIEGQRIQALLDPDGEFAVVLANG